MLELIKIIIGSSIPIILGLLVWLLKKEHEKRVNVEKQLSDKKYTCYKELVEFIFSIQRKDKKKLDNKQLSDKMWKFNADLLMYASDDVLLAYRNYMMTKPDKSDPLNIVDKAYQIIIEIRKDMGKMKTEYNVEDLKKMLLIDYRNNTS